ncbi:PLDc N-terminal domain-containing protein [Corynebacterium terpenotabidum]|uniref:Cardiolipin synthase N-terminal domain-containing protein n=1 Tax=Corynebacterium terpenotabidum Y-11 TaxID=1200352 RepID=S4XHG8_9CORY|nr:PLD nuclease N-terminal domain-containing protein [Corynebacterium terpenotabidum]AGP31966.1 hypothetical protein A606_11635 [Corynebacterium terpenotabidum Y-11]
MIMTLAAVTAEDGGTTSRWGIVLTLFLTVLALALLAFIIAALVSIIKAGSLTAAGKILWVVVVFAFPLLGSLVWFIWGRSAQLQRLTL